VPIRSAKEPFSSHEPGRELTCWCVEAVVSPGRRTRCTTLCRQHQSFDVPAQYWRPECTPCCRGRHRACWPLSNETLTPSSLPCFPDRPAGGGLAGKRVTTLGISPFECHQSRKAPLSFLLVLTGRWCKCPCEDVCRQWWGPAESMNFDESAPQ